ncbi:MAG: hypothetical protein V4579_02655 [Pseudomonadota bacterium]
MGLLRKALFSAALFGAYKYMRPWFSEPTRGTHKGLRAEFATREQADLAVEHLVQEHRVDRSFVFVGPVGDMNSAGTDISGGDHASGMSSSQDRADGALHGVIEVTVPLGPDDEEKLRQSFRDAGATHIAAF